MLTLVNMQAESAVPFLEAVAAYLTRHAGIGVRLDDTGLWQERRERLFQAEAQLGFLCGLPYAWQADAPCPTVSLLAAPVMAAPRYLDQPIYFSDVVVRATAPIQKFAHLKGASWAYNEPDSHSGHWLTRYVLAKRRAQPDYFGRVVEAGSHLAALARVLAGDVDAAAIDSTVLDLELHARPTLASQIRLVETWGPSPMPPLLVSTTVPLALKSALSEALLAMHLYEPGRAALALGLMSRFAPVDDAAYDVIRRMACVAEAYPMLKVAEGRT